MSLTVTARGVGSRNTGSENTYVISPTSNLTAGCTAVLFVTYDNSGTNGVDPWSAITDSVGNVWYSARSSLNDPGAANAGVATRMFICYGVSSLTTANTITVSFGGITTVARAFALWEITTNTSGAVPVLMRHNQA